MFNANQSKLARNPKLLKQYINFLEKEIGHNFKIDGIIELGSFAKHEAVPKSDIDTRIYLSSPDFFILQTTGSRFSISKQKSKEKYFSEFLKKQNKKQVFRIDWFKFNSKIIKKNYKKLGVVIEFGLTDSRFLDHELKNLNKNFTEEHQLLLESNIVFDPKNFLHQKKSQIQGKIYKPLVKIYKERYLNNLPFEIYAHLGKDQFDKYKLQQSNQIQWVKWAVRSIRDAIGTQSYIQTGKLIYKKEDIFKFCNKFLSKEDVSVIKEIYSWKTDAKIRTKMIKDFIKNPNKYFDIFKKYTVELENVVKQIKKIKI